jgi:four helix bundle protein
VAYFDHEKLEVYQVARELNREVAMLLAALPRGHAESKENLSRATKSITRNIAEGGGRWRPADKIRFYHIARGSATECAAGLDELIDTGAIPATRSQAARDLAPRVVAMLIKLIRSLESRPSSPS